jgi:hypothetical protein
MTEAPQRERCKTCESLKIISTTKYRCKWNCCFVDPVDTCPCKPSHYKESRPHTPAPEAIRPKNDCFGKYQGVGDDKCFKCNDWGYCADVTEAARTATLKVLDELITGFEDNKNILCWLKGDACAFPQLSCRNCMIQHLKSLRQQVKI